MRVPASTPCKPRRGVPTAMAMAIMLSVPLLSACGGGDLLAPEATALHSPQDLAALQRATALNRQALATRIRGERPGGAAEQQSQP